MIEGSEALQDLDFLKALYGRDDETVKKLSKWPRLHSEPVAEQDRAEVQRFMSEVTGDMVRRAVKAMNHFLTTFPSPARYSIEGVKRHIVH